MALPVRRCFFAFTGVLSARSNTARMPGEACGLPFRDPFAMPLSRSLFVLAVSALLCAAVGAEATGAQRGPGPVITWPETTDAPVPDVMYRAFKGRDLPDLA